MKLFFFLVLLSGSTLTANAKSTAEYIGTTYAFLDYTNTMSHKPAIPAEIEDGNYFLLHGLRWSEDVTGTIVLLTIKNQSIEGKAYQFYEINGADVLQTLCRSGEASFSLNKQPIHHQLFYRDGVYDGQQVTFNKSGTAIAKTNFASGKRNGQYSTYHDNGQLYYQINYVNDKIDNGPLTFFHPNGNIQAKGTHDGRELLGKWTYYHPNQNIMATGTRGVKFKEVSGDNRTGQWFFYDIKGELIQTVTVQCEVFLSCGFMIKENYSALNIETATLLRQTNEPGIYSYRLPQIKALGPNKF